MGGQIGGREKRHPPKPLHPPLFPTHPSRWAADVSARDPTFFSTLVGAQSPRYLWIGCSDSRVPANQIVDLPAGAVFVHRNVGNLATHKDLNAMSALEYAVSVLKVEHVIVCGHHGCGAVAAALEADPAAPSLVNLWIADLRDIRNLNLDTLASVQGAASKVDRLVELNVVRQVRVCAAARGEKGREDASTDTHTPSPHSTPPTHTRHPTSTPRSSTCAPPPPSSARGPKASAWQSTASSTLSTMAS